MTHYYFSKKDGKLRGPLTMELPPVSEINERSAFWIMLSTLPIIPSSGFTEEGVYTEDRIEWRYEVAWRNPSGAITGWKTADNFEHYEEQPFQYRRKVAVLKENSSNSTSLNEADMGNPITESIPSNSGELNIFDEDFPKVLEEKALFDKLYEVREDLDNIHTALSRSTVPMEVYNLFSAALGKAKFDILAIHKGVSHLHTGLGECEIVLNEFREENSKLKGNATGFAEWIDPDFKYYGNSIWRQHTGYQKTTHQLLSKYLKSFTIPFTPSLPNLDKSTANLSQIPDKDKWLDDIRGQQGDAVAFAEWCCQNYYIDRDGESEKWFEYGPLEQHQKKSYTTSDLYALFTSRPGKQETIEASTEFYQVGEAGDVVGDYFGQIGKLGDEIIVRECEQSNDRISMLWRDNKIIAFVIEARTAFNDTLFVKGTTIPRPGNLQQTTDHEGQKGGGC